MKPLFRWAIKVNTQKEAEKLKQLIKSLGFYIPSHLTYSENNCFLLQICSSEPERLGFASKGSIAQSIKTHIVNEWNEELIKAVILATEGDEFQVGEYAVMNKTAWEDRGEVFKDFLYKVEGFNNYKDMAILQNNGIICNYDPRHFRKPTFEELLNHFKVNRKITGYKLKKDLPNLEKGCIFLWENDKRWRFRKESISYAYDSNEVKNTEWFEPLYEEQEKTVPILAEGGSFDVKVKKDGIYFENTRIDPENLRKYVNVAYGQDNFLGTEWKVEVLTVNIGCKKNIKREALKQVIDAYDSLK
jgi:hypothetical protein